MNRPLPFENLLPAVREASLAEMRFFKTGFSVELKKDNTPVTSADIEANRILLSALQKFYPEIPVVSEESELPSDFDPEGRFFLVDPLDGTSDFVSKRSEFTVNIALVERRRVVLGIVSAPALNELFYGYRNIAFKAALDDVLLENVRPLVLSKRFSPTGFSGRPRVLVSVSHVEPATEELLKKIPCERVPVGSSLKFLRIADGFADCYPRPCALHEWDIAAGHGVLKAAGGDVYRFGTELEVEYGQKDFVSPPFFAY